MWRANAPDANSQSRRRVFALNGKGFTAARALKLLWLLSVPRVVLVEMDDEKYLLNVVFAVLLRRRPMKHSRVW